MSTLKCSKCDCLKFTVTAHVTETWLVDSHGEFLDIVDTHGEETVTHRPTIDSGNFLFSCEKCGTEAVTVP